MGENSVSCTMTYVLNSMGEFPVNVILYSVTKSEYFLLTCVEVLVWFFPQNFLTTVAILLEAGAYVNMQQSSGETALMKVNSVFALTGFDCNTFAKLGKYKNVFVEFISGTRTVFGIKIPFRVTLSSFNPFL